MTEDTTRSAGPIYELTEREDKEVHASLEGLTQVEDPEMPISIVDLGLVYGIERKDETIHVTITFTYTGCPARSYIKQDIRKAVLEHTSEDITEVEIHTTYSPEWDYDMISENGRDELSDFGISVPDADAS